MVNALKNLLLHPTHGRSRGQAMILLAVSFVGLRSEEHTSELQSH